MSASVADLLTRLDGLTAKYEKYTPESAAKAAKATPAPDETAFDHLLRTLEGDVAALEEKAADAREESNRAAAAAANAEVRRAKATLRGDFPKLEKLAMKKVKGKTKEDLEEQLSRAHALEERLEAVADGAGALGLNARRKDKARASSSKKAAEINLDDVKVNPVYAETTEESRAFRQEYEEARGRQDEQIEQISRGLSTLKGIASEMNEELDRQDPLINTIDGKVETVNTELKTTNGKLKTTLHKLRSSRNFCIDVVLIIVLLGIGAYIYQMVS